MSLLLAGDSRTLISGWALRGMCSPGHPCRWGLNPEEPFPPLLSSLEGRPLGEAARRETSGLPVGSVFPGVLAGAMMGAPHSQSFSPLLVPREP